VASHAGLAYVNLPLAVQAAKEGDMDTDFAPLFSRPMRVSGLGDKPAERRIEASQAECAALAGLFKLPAIQALRGDFTLAHERGGVISGRLTLFARLTQTCVITLEDFGTELREAAGLRFVPAAAVKEGAEIELDPETLEGPDEIFYAGESIDLGAVLAEQLALALDPYPKKPGATLAAPEDASVQNPFAALARLRKREN
jgi:uncharacterized metal-binding protein YceD (DUF177 family)